MNTRWDGSVMVRCLFKYWNWQESRSHDSVHKVHDGINKLIDEIPNFIPLFKLKVEISYRVIYFRFITLLEHDFQYFIHGHPHKLTPKINTLITNDRLIRSTDTYFCPLWRTNSYVSSTLLYLETVCNLIFTIMR